MVSLREVDRGPANPIDVLEELVSANDWPFERSGDCELMVTIAGRWCDYHLYFVWQTDVGAIFFSCHFDAKVPPNKRGAVHALLAAVNETLWLGHFDLSSEDGAIIFRHTIPLRGVHGVSAEQLEDMVDTAGTECERFYPAFQLVLWGGRTADQAIQAALMETVGEA